MKVVGECEIVQLWVPAFHLELAAAQELEEELSVSAAVSDVIADAGGEHSTLQSRESPAGVVD
ncbi:hypothetical protein FRC20_004376 [Serendipita sp. 405]|nr:hypothetical protein FRC20_004376 [Serendipita sp. 405]